LAASLRKNLRGRKIIVATSIQAIEIMSGNNQESPLSGKIHAAKSAPETIAKFTTTS
jgi:hypothetical protein